MDNPENSGESHHNQRRLKRPKMQGEKKQVKNLTQDVLVIVSKFRGRISLREKYKNPKFSKR